MINKLCVFDFETDGASPSDCEPVQLAACIVDTRTLEVIDDSIFCIDMRPIDIDEDGYFDKHAETIAWHANNYKCSSEEVFSKWKNAVGQKEAFNEFVNYVNKYNRNPSKPNRFGAVVRAGMNIRRFDNVIIDRLCVKYDFLQNNEQKIFHPRDTIDLMDFFMYWFCFNNEIDSYTMDNMRKYFGIPKDGGHDAKKDVLDEAWLITKFMKLHKELSPRIKFKGSYKG